jgi:hypothetical protein
VALTEEGKNVTIWDWARGRTSASHPGTPFATNTLDVSMSIMGRTIRESSQ